MLRVEQGATSSINQELFQLFQIYYTFGEKVSCGFAFFFHVSWYLPAKLNEYSLVNSSQEYEEEDHYYYNGYHENYEEESDGERSYRPRRLRRRRGNFTSMRRFFHDSKFFVEANYKLNIHRTDVFHVNVKVNYSTVTHLWIKASNNKSPPTTLHLRQNFLKLWITILWSQV